MTNARRSATATIGTVPLGVGVSETPNRERAFPRLDQDQCQQLRQLGSPRSTTRGEVLFAAGRTDDDFFLIEAGAVVIVHGHGRQDRIVGVHGPRRFVGELGMLLGQPAYLSGVVRDAGQVVQIPAAQLRELVASDPALSDLILGALIARRSVLVDAGVGIRLIGSRFSPDTRRLREFLVRNRVPHQWCDLEVDTEAVTTLDSLGVRAEETPVVIDGRGDLLRRPSNARIGRALGLSSNGKSPSEGTSCDVLVIGAGPGGLSAAMYGASEGLAVRGVEAVASGGQAGTSSRIENYLGFPAGVSGSDLTQRAGVQAAKFGARLAVPVAAASLQSGAGGHEITFSDGGAARARAVVVATGAQYRRLDVPRLDEFEGGGVYYAATQVEAGACAGGPVIVIGGGNSAGQAAVLLSELSSECRLLIRGDDLGKSMSRYLVEQVEANPRIEVCKRSELAGVGGGRELETATVRDLRSDQETCRPTQAIFIFIGASPHTEWLEGQLAIDDAGFLLTGRELPERDLEEFAGTRPLFLETSRPGVFAIGDVRSGSIKRVASAVGEGSMAIRLVHQRLSEPVPEHALARIKLGTMPEGIGL